MHHPSNVELKKKKKRKKKEAIRIMDCRIYRECGVSNWGVESKEEFSSSEA